MALYEIVEIQFIDPEKKSLSIRRVAGSVSQPDGKALAKEIAKLPV